MLLWIIAFLIIIGVCIYKYLILPHKYWQKHNVAHVKPWPLFGSFAPIVFRRQSMPEWMQKIYNTSDDEQRYVAFYSFLQPILMLKDLNLIKQIGIKDFDHFPDHQSFIPEDIAPIFGKNLFSLKGQKWRHMRSTLSPAFTSNKMRAMFVLICECADQFVDYFAKQVDPNQPLTIEMKDVFSRIANDVIATTAFGIKCDSLNEKNNDFYLMGKEISDFGGTRSLKFLAYNICPALVKALNIRMFSDELSNYFKNIIINNIETREKQGIIRPDMIHLLMEARKGKLKHEETMNNKDDDAGFATVEESLVGKDTKQLLKELSDDDVTAQALIFFAAGFESISNSISYMAHELAVNEEIQAKLQEEIDVTWKECNGKVTYDVLTKMKYMDMVVCESLRKWPVVLATDRICFDSYTIPAEKPGEQTINMKKGDFIWIPTFAIHRDPKYFPDPDRFDPERFSDENKRNIQPNSYLPFGIGPRNCIGSRFALMEAKIIFFYLLSKFSLVIVEESQVPLRLSKTQMTMTAEKGFWLGLKLRN